MIKIERESIEPIYVTITEKATGAAVVPSKLSLVKSNVRPSEADWIDPDTDDDRPCFRPSGALEPGKYVLRAKVSDPPWAPVLKVEDITVS